MGSSAPAVFRVRPASVPHRGGLVAIPRSWHTTGCSKGEMSRPACASPKRNAPSKDGPLNDETTSSVRPSLPMSAGVRPAPRMPTTGRAGALTAPARSCDRPPVKRKIAVLGGGMASLAAVHELTSLPGWRDRYEITVYQMGFRLGGKGASGRNAEAHHRIEEHGLHVLWGFYENTFRLLRECYEELGRPPRAPLATMSEAFLPHDSIVLPERGGDTWSFRWMTSVRNSGVPGTGTHVLAPWEYITRLLRFAEARSLELLGAVDGGFAVRLRELLGAELPGLRRMIERLGQSVGSRASAVKEALETTVRKGLGRTVVAAVGAAQTLWELATSVAGLKVAELIAADTGRKSSFEGEQGRREVLVLLDVVGASLRRYLEDESDQQTVGTEVDLLLTLVRGLIADGLATGPRDWFSLDDESFRQWLSRHGARPESVNSALVEGLHAAAYCGGTEIGAGTLTYALLRLAFTYQGAILYKMAAGMGETVFAPLYQVLARRGVRFEFFHTVDHLELSEDRRRVARIVIDRQATVRKGPYRPLYEVDGLPCWPTRPLYDQLEEGEALRAGGHELEDWWGSWPAVERRVLRDRQDFDMVILGISLGALGEVCRELVADEGNPRFRAMVEHVRTVPTQSAQLWFNVELERLGWRGGSSMVIPFASPFDSWADMTHLLTREQWPERSRPGSLAYVTSRLDETEPIPPRGPSDYPARLRARMAENLEGWLGRRAWGLWPRATSRHDHRELNWHWLHDPEDRDGPARLQAQFVSPLMNPSDRYVIAAPGTNRHRLRPGESGYENLVLAGDWTLTSLSIGCIEAAALAGNRAAAAIDAAVRPAIGDWLTELDAGGRRGSGEAPVVMLARKKAPPATRSATGATAIRAARDLPRFVVRDGALLATPPIALDIDVTMFVLRADPARLQAVCDQQLNLGGPVRYRPFAPVVVLYCASVDNHPLVERLGWVPEIDFGIWIPLVAGREERGVFRPERVVTYTPYIWVSNDVALNNGRLFYGFPKDLGTMVVPRRAEDPAVFSLDTWVIPTFGPKHPIEHRRLLEVRRTDGGREGPLRELRRAGEVMARALGAVAGLRDNPALAWFGGLDVLRGVFDVEARGMKMVFLKQFPDVEDGRRACYQAIVEGEVRIVGDVETALLPGSWEATIHTYDSHRLVETLGLSVVREQGRSRVLAPLAQGTARFPARIEEGQVIWEHR
ncbi:MAG: NAD(P)-binding protein [Hyalangium sp.]|uniref:NAD(P)-binding protein n=1 Tax=Hyalangium sp. TaxID=2028555 RepID=UPI003899CD8E